MTIQLGFRAHNDNYTDNKSFTESFYIYQMWWFTFVSYTLDLAENLTNQVLGYIKDITEIPTLF